MVENRYVRCDSHCKHEAYDKSQIDVLLRKKANALDVPTYSYDYKVIEFEMTIPANSTKTTPLLNHGFAKGNFVVLAVIEQPKDATYWRKSNNLDIKIFDDTFEVTDENTTDANVTKTYRVLLQKTTNIELIVEEYISQDELEGV